MKIEIIGDIMEDGISFSHNLRNGESVYKFTVGSTRNSGVVDEIPCQIVSGFLDSHPGLKAGDKVHVFGEIRTRNYKKHLEVYVWCNSLDNALDSASDVNRVELEKGFIAKEPTFRKTKKNWRSISDLIVAVNEERYNKSSYIPCLAWGRYANMVKDWSIGSEVRGTGRFQSRYYDKNVDGIWVTKITYEISLNNIEEVRE